MSASAEARALRRAAALARHPSIAATGGVFCAALLAFIAIGAALPVLPGYVHGVLHSGTSRWA